MDALIYGSKQKKIIYDDIPVRAITTAIAFFPFCGDPPREIISIGIFIETICAAPRKSVIMKQRLKL